MRLTAGRAQRWARSQRNALVSVQEDAVDDVEGPQAPIALPVENDLLVLLEFPREQSHVAGLCGPGHCAVELAMREDALETAGHIVPYRECLDFVVRQAVGRLNL